MSSNGSKRSLLKTRSCLDVRKPSTSGVLPKLRAVDTAVLDPVRQVAALL